MCKIDRDYLPAGVPCPFKRGDEPLCHICDRESGNPMPTPADSKPLDELVEDKLHEREMCFANRIVLARSYDYIFTGDLWLC